MKTKYSLIFLLFIIFSLPSFAQSLEDKDLLLSHNVENPEFNDRVVRYGFKNAKYKGIVYHTLSSSMYIYQKVISPILSRSCAYSPSCSAYSKELIGEYGLIRGVIFTADRLSRCNKIALTGKGADFLDSNGKHYESVFYYSFKHNKQ